MEVFPYGAFIQVIVIIIIIYTSNIGTAGTNSESIRN